MLPVKLYSSVVVLPAGDEKVGGGPGEYPESKLLSVKKTWTSFSEMRLAVLLSLMSLKSSQQVAVPLPAPSQSTTGIAFTLMACVHFPVFASNVTGASVLKPCSVGLAWRRT